MHAVDARGIRACPLAFVLADVDPALRVSLPHNGEILFAERGQRFEGELLRLLIGELPVIVGDHRRVHVVHVQLVHAQHFPAQGDIVVHVLDFGMDARDQAVADSRVHIAAANGGLEGGRILPRAGVEDLFLHLSVVKRRPGVPELTVAGVELLEDIPAEFPVRGHLKRHETAVGNKDLVSLAVMSGREFEIRVREHAETVARGLRHLTGSGEELFHLLRERVVPEAADLADRDLVVPDPGLLLIKALQHVFGNREDLRLHKGQLFADPGFRALHPQFQLLIARIRCVLVVAHERIASHAVQLQKTLIISSQRLIQVLRAFGEPSLIFPDLFRQSFRLPQFLLPQVLVRIDVLQTPCHFFRYFFP